MMCCIFVAYVNPFIDTLVVMAHGGMLLFSELMKNTAFDLRMVNVQAVRDILKVVFTRAEPEAGVYVKTTEDKYPVRTETPYVNHFVVRHSPVPGLR